MRFSTSFGVLAVSLAGWTVIHPVVRADDQANVVAPPATTEPGDSPTPTAPPAAARAGEDVGQSSNDPLERIGGWMVDVQNRLRNADTSSTTLRRQEQIINGLVELISQQSRANSPQSTAGSQAERVPVEPGEQPGTNGGPSGSAGGEADGPASPKSLAQRIWGHLPDQVRAQVQTPLREEFLPKYEELIQDYFEYLARQPR